VWQDRSNEQLHLSHNAYLKKIHRLHFAIFRIFRMLNTDKKHPQNFSPAAG